MDGVFSKAQADRGKAAYADNCSACHGEHLDGGGEAPGLTVSLLPTHEGAPLTEVFDIITTQMPLNAPGTVPPATAADILAFILQENGMKAGAADLPSDDAAVGTIKIKSK